MCRWDLRGRDHCIEMGMGMVLVLVLVSVELKEANIHQKHRISDLYIDCLVSPIPFTSVGALAISALVIMNMCVYSTHRDKKSLEKNRYPMYVRTYERNSDSSTSYTPTASPSVPTPIKSHPKQTPSHRDNHFHKTNPNPKPIPCLPTSLLPVPSSP